MKPLCIELFAGTFGWSQGWHELGGYTVGFDIEHQPYHGPVPKGDDLVLQDVLTLHGSQFKDASLILASSPCQAYSYMAMPWGRSKQIARALRGEDVFPDGYEGYRTIAELNALFEAPRRIQREASEAAGRHIPMIQENVRGAIPWVGRSQWNFGSFHLWGDVPALMPIIKAKAKVGGIKLSEVGFNVQACRNVKAENGLKTSGRSLSKGAANKFGTHNMGSAEMIERELGIKIGKVNRPDHTQVIDPERGTKGYAARLGDSQISRKHGSQSPARRAASAHIARIPTALSRHIAQVYYPLSAGRSAQQ